MCTYIFAIIYFYFSIGLNRQASRTVFFLCCSKDFLLRAWKHSISHSSVPCHIAYYGTKLKERKTVIFLRYYSGAWELWFCISHSYEFPLSFCFGFFSLETLVTSHFTTLFSSGFRQRIWLPFSFVLVAVTYLPLCLGVFRNYCDRNTTLAACQTAFQSSVLYRENRE